MKIKKNIFTRFIAMAITALTISIVCSLCFVTAMAAEVSEEPIVVETLAITEENDIDVDDAGVITFNLGNAEETPEVIMLAAGGSGSNSGDNSADNTYKKVVNFFVTWIKRIGCLVAFVGAIMFALAIKNNDAEQKQAGLLTLVAGFVVAAICQAVDMFDLFS